MDKRRAAKVYKQQQINEYEDEKRQNLLADYENDGYIPLFPLKISNYSVNLGEKIRSLTYLVNIKSIIYQVLYQHSF